MNVTSCGKRYSAGKIKWRILKWGDYPGLSRWAPDIITTVLTRGRQRRRQNKKAMCQLKQDAALLALKGPPAKEHRLPPRKLEKARRRTLPWSLQRELCPANTLILAQGSWFQASDLQSCKKINVCCFKSSSLWWLDSAAVGNQYTYEIIFDKKASQKQYL